MKLYLSILAILLSCATAAGATTYYVSPTGSDSNPGTNGSPFLTPQKCFDVAVAGDTCIFKNGTYATQSYDTFCSSSKPIVCMHGHGGTAGNPITFRAENVGQAIFDGGPNSLRQAFTGIGALSYFVFDGLAITGLSDPSPGSGGAAGIELFDFGSNSIIQNCIIHAIGNISTTTANGQVGIYFNVANTTIRSNYIYDIGRTNADFTHDHGIYHSAGDNALIYNNLEYNITHGWGIQEYPSSRDNAKILNNTFGGLGNADSGQPGFMVIYGNMSMTNSLIENNIYAPSSGGGTDFLHFSGTNVNFTGSTVANNLTTKANVFDTTPGEGTFTGNLLSTAAGFNNAGSNDYSITSGSAAKDAGLTLADVPVDILGVSRPQGSAYDIGAYELVQSSSSGGAAMSGKISGGVVIR